MKFEAESLDLLLYVPRNFMPALVMVALFGEWEPVGRLHRDSEGRFSDLDEMYQSSSVLTFHK